MKELREKIRRFVEERNWKQYHSPKNLAIGLSVEANELLELFMWLSEDESRNLPTERMAKIREEVGDVTNYLINFCDSVGIDPLECANVAKDPMRIEHRNTAEMRIRCMLFFNKCDIAILLVLVVKSQLPSSFQIFRQ